MQERRRVLSGIQPSGALHLGNYFGAVQQWVAGQGHKENFICIVDLHAITVTHQPGDLRRNTRALAAMLFACGIDPRATTLFVQSHVPAHSEATWLLMCQTPLGWLERMTQYKSKASRQETVGAGLLTYPVLQAADILLYQPHEVPVGDDQKQHVELCRDLAQRFNHLYGETFRIPEPVIPVVGARIMGLDDPTGKMSKSESSARGHAVRLDDDDDEIRRAFKRAVTDSGREIEWSDAPEKAGVNNLLNIYGAATGKGRHECREDFADARGYGDLKARVAEAVVAVVRPIRERYRELMNEPEALDELLEEGAHAARRVAGETLERMRENMGFLRARG